MTELAIKTVSDKDELISRRAVRGELMGSHTHTTEDGVAVHVWKRRGTYLARDSHQRQRFAEATMNIYEYMTARAAHEGKTHTLPRVLYEAWFDLGIRTFFGVRVNASGRPIEDQQNPEFFKTWKGIGRARPAN